ncbi:MAG TPA: hypothetical protein VFD58_10265 [Blastocatellia bacterium]|nr:hypothetical protein [Blastocatellia bacterium]
MNLLNHFIAPDEVRIALMCDIPDGRQRAGEAWWFGNRSLRLGRTRRLRERWRG